MKLLSKLLSNFCPVSNYFGCSLLNWSGRQDLNLRPLAPHASALPGCATPRERQSIQRLSQTATGELVPARGSLHEAPSLLNHLEWLRREPHLLQQCDA